jgi:DHA2 family multidrug resistance protein
VSFVAFAVSYFMRSGFTAQTDFFHFVLPLLVQGIAMATFFLSMITILLDGVPPQRIPLASGLSNFARITSGGFAASLVTTVWDRREAVHQSRLADHTSTASAAFNQAIAGLHPLGLNGLAAQGAVNRTLVGEAYLLASDDIFWASGWICIVLIPMIWLCRRPAGATGPVAAD